LPTLDVAFEGLYSVGQLDFSRTGTLVYRKASGGGSLTLKTVQWVDPAGKKEPLLARPGAYCFASLSPDGKRIALRVTEGGSDAWIYDPQRDAMTRVTTGGMDTCGSNICAGFKDRNIVCLLVQDQGPASRYGRSEEGLQLLNPVYGHLVTAGDFIAPGR
jgi:hypothetical protein